MLEGDTCIIMSTLSQDGALRVTLVVPAPTFGDMCRPIAPLKSTAKFGCAWDNECVQIQKKVFAAAAMRAVATITVATCYA